MPGQSEATRQVTDFGFAPPEMLGRLMTQDGASATAKRAAWAAGV